jgi:hypothetical protein
MPLFGAASITFAVQDHRRPFDFAQFFQQFNRTAGKTESEMSYNCHALIEFAFYAMNIASSCSTSKGQYNVGG